MNVRDENTQAELLHDMNTKWDDSDEYLKERERKVEALLHGKGFSYYGIQYDLDDVIESVVNDRYTEDIDENMLLYAVQHPDSYWYKVVADKCKEFAEKFEE